MVTQARPVSVTLDIDHGYEIGDPILWLSKLTLYDDGQPGRAGPGLLRPEPGRRRQHDLVRRLPADVAHARGHLLRRRSAAGSSRRGLPVGVDYDLQVSVAEPRRSRASSSRRRRCRRTRTATTRRPQSRRRRDELVHVLQQHRSATTSTAQRAVRSPRRRRTRRSCGSGDGIVRPLLVHRHARRC